jgi:diaminohydroxyphosphoribosylaminopyrimidine deaminase/5-amino-6-(5-phosphoribosylamino)uracil reductase
MDDLAFMQQALRLAARGRGRTAPNPMVGAVVVRGGRVVGQGYHRRLGGEHAEVHALASAGRAAKGATLYVTLEPCNHTGRTPPCTEAILAAGIGRVVVAMADPNPNVRGGGMARLRAVGIAVTLGPGRLAAERLNEAFIRLVTAGRPLVTLKCAATLDGRIAAPGGDARWVSGEASRREAHRMRHRADAILVGVGTVLRDDPELTTRLAGRRTRNPRRVVLDTRLSIPEGARLLDAPSDAQTVIFCAAGHDAAKRRRLENRGIGVIVAAQRDGRVDAVDALRQLADLGVAALLVEGGAALAAALLHAGVIDKLALFLAPKLMGGEDGVPLFRGAGAARMGDALPLHHMRLRRCGADLLIEGYLQPPPWRAEGS